MNLTIKAWIIVIFYFFNVLILTCYIHLVNIYNQFNDAQLKNKYEYIIGNYY